MEQLSFDDLCDSPEPSKQCARCGETKPLAEFGTDRRFPDGCTIHCLPCDAVMRRRRAAARRPGSADFRKRKANSRRQYIRLKVAVFDHYGWVCACCGAETKRPEIDHIDGNGRAHRIELFGRHDTGGPPFYAWLIKNGFPEGFQTLCGRCNRAKGATDRCPLVHTAKVGEW